LIGLLLAGDVRADEPLTLQQLAEKVQQQQLQIQQLQTQAQPPAVDAPSSASLLDRDLFQHRSADGRDYRPRVNLFGRLHIDTQLAGQSTENIELLGDLQNTVGFRRARLGAEGDIHRDVYWKAEFDFAGGDIAFRDVYVALRNIPWLQEIRVGHFREPFSLEAATSSNNITLMERSTSNQFDPGRNWGVGIFSFTPDEVFTWSLAAFRSSTDNTGTADGDNNDMAYDVRLTASPMYESTVTTYRVMHVGGAISYRVPINNLVTFKPTRQLVVAEDSPPSPLTVPLQIPANHWELYNLLWAMVNGPWSVQTEWTGVSINQLGGKPVFLHGCYAQCSYFPTGDHRHYDRRTGAFDGVQVRSPWNASGGSEPGWGALELAWRLDYLDTSDPNIPEQPIGNKQIENLYTSTLGINWYLNNYTRLMLNYTYGLPVDIDSQASVAHLVGIRFAIHW